MVQNTEVLIVFSYAIPSILLYSTIIFLLAKKFDKPPFISPFYKFFIVIGCLDISCWILLFLQFRARNVTWFYWFYQMLPSEGFSTTFIVWLGYYTFYAEFTTYFFITLNRFTSVSLPTMNQEIWDRLFPVSIVIIFLIPFPFTWHILVAGGFCIPNDDHNPPLFGYRLDAHTVFNIQNSLYGMIFTFVAGATGFLMNSWMLACLCLRRKSKNTTGHAVSDTKDSETKLFLFSLLTFIAFSMTLALQIMFFLNPNMSEEVFLVVIDLQLYAFDLFMLSPPWFILILSKSVRKEFLKMVGLSNSKILFVNTGFATKTAVVSSVHQNNTRRI